MAHLGWRLCLVAVACCTILQGAASYYQVMDCCLRTSPRPIPQKILCSYREQQIQAGCPIRAVVFTTVKGRQLCAPPFAPWVKHLKECLNRRLKRPSLSCS